MSTPTAPMTVAEFLKLPDEISDRYELSEGRLVERDGPGGMMANWRHERVKGNLTRILNRFLEPDGSAEVLPETTFALSEEVTRRPDLCVRGLSQPTPEAPDKPFSGAPDLPIEVVSSETAAELENRIAQYFAAGARAVWAIFPEVRAVRRYSPSGDSQILHEEQVLEEPEVLPGFRVAVRDIFERT